MCLGIDQMIEEAVQEERLKAQKANENAMKAEAKAQREKTEKEVILKEYMKLKKQLDVLTGNHTETIHSESTSV